MSHRPFVCLIYRPWVSFATLPTEKWLKEPHSRSYSPVEKAEAAFCFGGIGVRPWSVGQDASHHTDGVESYSTYKGKYMHNGGF